MIHAEISARESLPLHECNFAVLQSKIAAVGSKAKFHIKPRSGLMREANTSAALETLSALFTSEFSVNCYVTTNSGESNL